MVFFAVGVSAVDNLVGMAGDVRGSWVALPPLKKSENFPDQFLASAKSISQVRLIPEAYKCSRMLFKGILGWGNDSCMVKPKKY